MSVQIDPRTGERIKSPLDVGAATGVPTTGGGPFFTPTPREGTIEIDPQTGERLKLTATVDPRPDQFPPLSIQPSPRVEGELQPPVQPQLPDYIPPPQIAPELYSHLKAFMRGSAAQLPESLIGLGAMAVTPALNAATQMAQQFAGRQAAAGTQGALAQTGAELVTGVPAERLQAQAGGTLEEQAELAGRVLTGTAVNLIPIGGAVHGLQTSPRPHVLPTPDLKGTAPSAFRYGGLRELAGQAAPATFTEAAQRIKQAFTPQPMEAAPPPATPPSARPVWKTGESGSVPLFDRSSLQQELQSLAVKYSETPDPAEQAALSARMGEITRQMALGPLPDAGPARPQIDPEVGAALDTIMTGINRTRYGGERGSVNLFGGENPVWRSRLEDALPSWPEAAHPNKYLTLAKSATSADELKWTGLEAMLQEAAKANRKLSRNDIAQHLKENRLEVEEVELVDPTDVTPPSDFDRNQLAAEFGGEPEDFRYVPDNSTKFHPTSGHSQSLSLPGGRRYRELLIKMPGDVDAQRIDTLTRELQELDREQAALPLPMDPGYTPAVETHARNLRRQTQNVRNELVNARERGGPGRPIYTSPHWPGQPNVVAHVRFDERISPEGKRVLFIEEGQSDWHQAGREKGYQTGPAPDIANIIQELRRKWIEADARVNPLRDRANQIATIQRGEAGRGDFLRDVIDFRPDQWAQRGVVNGTLLGEGDMAFLRQYHEAVQDSYHAAGEVTRAERHAEQLGRGQVPDAPFKGTKWQEVILRRMLRYAAENGYDEVQWTTGLQQTTRYNDLVGQALGEGRLDWTYQPPVDPRSRILSQHAATIELLHPQTGQMIWSGPPADLPGAVGKELAARVMADIEAHVPEPRGESAQQIDPGGHFVNVGSTTFDPSSAIGGAGFVQQYDVNMPNIANKIGKAWGASVRKGKVQLPDFPRAPRNISEATFRIFQEEGEAAARRALHLTTSDQTVVDTMIREMKRAAHDGAVAEEPVWSLPITPAMRSSVMKGQPLGIGQIGPLGYMFAASVGGVAGGLYGDTPEERLRNAFLGTLGGAALIPGLKGAYRTVVPPKAGRPTVVDTLPQVFQDRLRQSVSLRGRELQQFAKRALTAVHDTTVDTFLPEHVLRSAGFGDVADRIGQYKAAYLDISAKANGRLKSVLQDLTSPEDYKEFWALVAARHDLNTARGKLTPESGLSIPDLTGIVQTIETGVPPHVLDAANRHRNLMVEVGMELVRSGQLDASTITRNADYFPDIVLQYLLQQPDPTKVTPGRREPITKGSRFYLLQRHAGTRETLRDYAKATTQYLVKVEEGLLKDQLVNDIKTKHGWTPPPNRPNARPPKGYSAFWYDRGGEAIFLPDAITTRLKGWQNNYAGPAWALTREMTNKWKGLVLRMVWGGFALTNWLGDVTYSFTSTPFWKWDDVYRTLKEAEIATRDLMGGEFNSQTFQPLPRRRADNLLVAEMGQQEGLGTGAATTELANIKRDPKLRKLEPPPKGMVGRGLHQLAEWRTEAVHRMDLFREYGENAPRLAEFMRQLENGERPEHAAAITRKVMIDYTNLTPREEALFRGLIFPFYAFYKNNFMRHVPGLASQAMPDMPNANLRAALSSAQGLGLVALTTAFNEWMNPEIERNLKAWERMFLHLNIPYGIETDETTGRPTMKYVVLMLPDPFTLAASTLGLGGIPQRTVDILKGRTDMRDTLAESGRQARWATTSLISPILQQIWALGSEALGEGSEMRSGRNISQPEAGWKERFVNHVRHAATLWAPLSQVQRIDAAGPGDVMAGDLPSKEGVASVAKSFLIGSLARTGSTAEDELERLRAADAKGKERYTEEQYQEVKSPLAERFASQLEPLGRKEAAQLLATYEGSIMTNLKGQERQKALSVLAEGLRRASVQNRQLKHLYNNYKLKRLPSLVSDEGKVAPYAPLVLEEMKKLYK